MTLYNVFLEFILPDMVLHNLLMSQMRSHALAFASAWNPTPFRDAHNPSPTQEVIKVLGLQYKEIQDMGHIYMGSK
jgi:hypothetical protein